MIDYVKDYKNINKKQYMNNKYQYEVWTEKSLKISNKNHTRIENSYLEH